MSGAAQPLGALLAAQRILVLGPCGSGKTRLTRELSAILGLPAVHLDARFWHPGWIPTPQPEWRRTVAALVREPRWIMDGTYESTLDLRLPAAEALVMLDRPRWSCLWGVLRRSLVYRNRPRPDAPAGQPIDRAYLRYIWRYPAQTETLVRALIARHAPRMPIVQLADRAGVEQLLAGLRTHRRVRPA
ncbi:MAG: adenylate kinase [Pseudomonadota bacterium]